MEDTPVVKRRAAPKKSAAAPAAPETLAASTEAAAGEPAAEAPKAQAPTPTPARKPKANLAERLLTAAQFHTGVQLGTVTKTGINAKHFQSNLRLEVEMRLTGPGVWIKLQGQEFVVPFSNVLSVTLAPEEAA